ncbi:MAG: prepilin-type N-terminal cleavage/methylation domain-containing protein [Candidatus Saccharibacteria bacterium]
MNTKKQYFGGFTIVEVMAVVIIIGILATVTYVAYSGLQTRARDVNVLSDLDSMEGLQTSYGLKNNVGGKAYYSGSGIDNSLSFKAGNGDVIDVVVNSTEYCIRGYNTQSTKNSIDNAAIRESTPGICNTLYPSLLAVSGSSGIKVWKQITVGTNYNFNCGIASDDKAYCWGNNDYGQLGNNSITTSRVPIPVNTSGVFSGKTITSIETGEAHTCAIASDNLVYCWGRNQLGALGNNSTVESHVPVAVTSTGVLSGKTIKSLSSGADHTCVVASDNLAYCWGYNSNGQLGNGSTTQSNVPVAVATTGVLSGKTIKSISSGRNYTCVIASDNLVYCWGAGTSGQLGNNAYLDSLTPVAVNTAGVLSGKTVKSISVGNYFTCLIASDDLAYCWGYNYSGQLGNNSATQQFSVPVAVNTAGLLNGKTIKSIASGASNACAIASDNLSYCWGVNNAGQLGNNSTVNSLVPVAVINTTGLLNSKIINYISTGAVDTCVIASDYRTYCWGQNMDGNLGNNSITNSLMPVLVQAP